MKQGDAVRLPDGKLAVVAGVGFDMRWRPGRGWCNEESILYEIAPRVLASIDAKDVILVMPK